MINLIGMLNFVLFNHKFVIKNFFFHFIQNFTQLFDVSWPLFLALRGNANVAVNMKISFFLKFRNSMGNNYRFLSNLFFFAYERVICIFVLSNNVSCCFNLFFELLYFLVTTFWTVWFFKSLKTLNTCCQ